MTCTVSVLFKKSLLGLISGSLHSPHSLLSISRRLNQNSGKDCGKYYLVQYASHSSPLLSSSSSSSSSVSSYALLSTNMLQGDTCQLVALNQTIALGLFEAMNPAINAECTNLELGVNYCVKPTTDWNTTVNSTLASAPTTTSSGTTAACYEYYIIVSGDYCGKVEDLFSITFGHLQYWNPSLLSDCSNLALGEAYCVNGVQQPATGGTPASATPTARVKRLDVGGIENGKAATPKGTSFPDGGVPRGLPALSAPRLQMGAGIPEPPDSVDTHPRYQSPNFSAFRKW